MKSSAISEFGRVGGPGLAAAFTAASVAKSAAHIAGIKSASAGGSVVSGSAFAAPAIAGQTAGAVETTQLAEFRISGEFLSSELIIAALQDAIDQGYVINGVTAG